MATSTIAKKLSQTIDGEKHEVLFGADAENIAIGNTNLQQFYNNWNNFKEFAHFTIWTEEDLASRPNSSNPNMKIWYNPEW